ncbi:MAG TPA: glycoside hydrolase family 3 protein [Candidatus Limnocylindrales bacterium]|nr:glycoside hydrolase family 3 protein [Candidatus Limnocylindrales bacterium]
MVVDARDRLLVSFAGFELSPEAAEAIVRRASGVTLYRHLNVGSPAAVRALTESLQAAAARLGFGPLLIGADHETGQLHAMGEGATPFPGSMALGAVGDDALAERVGAAIGAELRAMGVTVVFAPDCDLATNPRNPVVGIRAFGDDPAVVGRMVAAQVRGLQSAGVAATVKHLPGHGEPGGDSHLGLPVVEVSADELRARELVPFRAGIAAGARLAMAGHLGVPALTGERDVPATLSRAVVTDLLRGELGFDGVAVSDALDMGGVQGGAGAGPDVLAALTAGTDLLLCGPDPEAQVRVEAALAAAVTRLDPAAAAASSERIDALRAWIAGFRTPPVDVVGSAAHRAIADEVARRSTTRIRDRERLLGRPVAGDARILVIEPEPVDLTPADTTSWLRPAGLADAIRARGRHVEGIVSRDPIPAADVAAIRDRASAADLVVFGTVDALGRPSLVELGRALAAAGPPVVAVALRAPWDADVLPELGTVIATYGIQPPQLAAAATVIVDGAGLSGRLPVRVASAS